MEIKGVKEQVVLAYPSIFPPGMPQSNPDSYPDLIAVLNYLSDQFPNGEVPPPSLPSGTSPPKDRCDEAKALTDALKKALAMIDILNKMNDLKGTKGSSIEHGIMITRDSQGGYHVSDVILGTKNPVQFNYF